MTEVSVETWKLKSFLFFLDIQAVINAIFYFGLTDNGTKNGHLFSWDYSGSLH